MKEENKHHDLERTKHLVTSAPLLISTKCIAFLLELVAMHLLLVTISRTYAKPRQCDHLSDHTLWGNKPRGLLHHGSPHVPPNKSARPWFSIHVAQLPSSQIHLIWEASYFSFTFPLSRLATSMIGLGSMLCGQKPPAPCETNIPPATRQKENNIVESSSYRNIDMKRMCSKSY